MVSDESKANLYAWAKWDLSFLLAAVSAFCISLGAPCMMTEHNFWDEYFSFLAWDHYCGNHSHLRNNRACDLPVGRFFLIYTKPRLLRRGNMNASPKSSS